MKVNPIYRKEYFLAAGDANAEGELSLPLLTAHIIDIATEHANLLGIGNPNMTEISAGWVLSRISIEMERYPKVNEKYFVETWITNWNRHFSERCFCVYNENNEVLGYSRTIWMVMSTKTHENVGLSHLSLEEGMVSDKECPIARQAKHQNILRYESVEASEKDLIATAPDSFYRFKYCDLDFYRHVNTIRYVELLLNQFPLKYFDEMSPCRLELSFMHESKYGMEVIIRKFEKTPVETSFLLKDSSDDRSLFYARLFFSKRD